MARGYVGIDLGTTFSGVVVSSNGDTQVVRDPVTGLAKFPSAVYFLEGDPVPLIGVPAISEATIDARLHCLATQFKRQIGSAHKYSLGKDFSATAEELSVCVLKKCVSMAYERLPGIPHSSIDWAISIPARFGEPAKAATLRAAVAAGIPHDRVMLVLEPEAAAITAHLNRRLDLKTGEHIILFDFGGGTLDIVVVERRADGLNSVVIDAGNPRLGGIDADQALATAVVDIIRSTDATVPPWNTWTAQDRFHLLRQVEQAKQSICGSRGMGGAPRHRLLVPVGRRVFRPELNDTVLRKALQPILSAAADALHKAVTLCWDRAGIKKESIAWALLAGGSSQLLGIREMIIDATHPAIRVAMPDDPWESIARGACAFAEDSKIILSKISGETYGIRSSRDHREGDPVHRLFATSYGAKKCRMNSVFFVRGQKIARNGVTQSFSTIEDNQTRITFAVLRGDSEDPDDCEMIGTLVLRVPSRKRGYTAKCSFRIDDGNRLRVEAWDPATTERVDAFVEWQPSPVVGEPK